MKKENPTIAYSIVLTFLLLLTWGFSVNHQGGKTSLNSGSIMNNGMNLPVNEPAAEIIIEPLGSRLAANYVRLPDINQPAVSEIELSFNIVNSGLMVTETKDGLLCAFMAKPAVSVVTKYPKSFARIIKLDLKGNTVWDKIYGDATFSGRINNFLAYADGSFIFTIQTYPFWDGKQSIKEKSLLIRCDREGQVLWQREFQDYGGDSLCYLLLTETDEIITVSQGQSSNGIVTGHGPFDIIVTKFSQDGQFLEQKSYGGKDFENLRLARYQQGLGIIISGTTTSRDGEFAIRDERPHADFVACLSDKLTVKWVVQAKEQEHFIYDQLALTDHAVYILGQENREGSTPPTAGFLLRVDQNGSQVWKRSGLYPGLWGQQEAILANGNIAIGAGQINQGTILILDEEGRVKQKAENLKYPVQKILPTRDGGVIVTAIREIKTLPQPAYISCLWFDTELVAIKYGQDLSIQWRKTYDRYPDSRGIDYVFPLADSKLVVEGKER